MDKSEFQELGIFEVTVKPSYKNYKGTGVDEKAICEIEMKQTVLYDGGMFHVQHRCSGYSIDDTLRNLTNLAKKLKEQSHE